MIDYTIIINLCKIMILSYTISRFDPLKMILEILPDNLFCNLFRLALSCSKCLAFWTGIIIAGIWWAMLASFLMTIFEKTIGRWIDQVRLN